MARSRSPAAFIVPASGGAVELRIAGAWVGAHVGDQLDARSADQLEEVLFLVVRVTDGQDLG